MTAKLTGKQCRYLRGLGHHLQPVVMIGKDGINSNLTNAVEEALEKHELIKLRLQEGCMLERREAADLLAAGCNAAVAQILGNTILLYRPSEENLITLPVAAGN